MSKIDYMGQARRAAQNGILLLQIRRLYGPLAYVKPTPHPLEPQEIRWTVIIPGGATFSANTETEALLAAIAPYENQP